MGVAAAVELVSESHRGFSVTRLHRSIHALHRFIFCVVIRATRYGRPHRRVDVSPFMLDHWRPLRLVLDDATLTDAELSLFKTFAEDEELDIWHTRAFEIAQLHGSSSVRFPLGVAPTRRGEMYAAANAVGGAKTRDRQRERGGLQQEPGFLAPHTLLSGFLHD